METSRDHTDDHGIDGAIGADHPFGTASHELTLADRLRINQEMDEALREVNPLRILAEFLKNRLPLYIRPQ